MLSYEPPTLTDIEAATDRIAGTIVRTPVVRLPIDDTPAEIWLKLENLQPIGSFKLRGATNALALTDPARLANGVWTASAGNMAQGVAWGARARGIPCTVVVPESAPQTKLAAITRLGAEIIKVPFDDWFAIFKTRTFPGLNGLFIHAFSDPAVIAGNGTIGLELIEDLPDLDAVVVPYGGGGLCCGITAAIRALAPQCRIYACEVEGAAPLAASLAAEEPVEINYTPSFVDGIGGPRVEPEMFALTKRLIDDSLVATVDEVAAAVRLLAERNRVIAEGAGATAAAVALAGKAGLGKVACIVSGGNLDPAKLATILSGGVP